MKKDFEMQIILGKYEIMWYGVVAKKKKKLNPSSLVGDSLAADRVLKLALVAVLKHVDGDFLKALKQCCLVSLLP